MSASARNGLLIGGIVLVGCGAIVAVFEIAQHSSPAYKLTDREAASDYSTAQHPVRSADCTPHVLSFSYPGDYDFRCVLHYADGTTAVARVHDRTFNAGSASQPFDKNDWTFFPPTTS